ncbi:CRISPR system precrRNA processing endoribonuclease RAMP protein Cas6 [Candidatus Bathyarchaeota archaeon]|nr:CRISPR system precrRNA processing endoribonuclease RAMP protein Cas6 [Candidatus Bathyarchaeota archaeon]
MPVSVFSVKFHVDRAIVFQSFSGFAVRGIVYEAVRDIDPETAENLHSSKKLAPFSTSPILLDRRGDLRVAYRALPKGSACRVRFVFFDGGLAKTFMDALTGSGFKFKVIDTQVEPEEVEVSELSYSTFVKEAREVRKFSIEFLTPTYFRISPLIASRLLPTAQKRSASKKLKSAYRFHPLPEPILLLRSAVRIWKTFSDRKFNYTAYLDWVTTMGVALAGFPRGIKTHRVYEHKTTDKWVVGFKGLVNYNLPEDTYKKRWATVTDALLKFAEYSNVGGGRTAGLGMMRYKPAQNGEE